MRVCWLIMCLWITHVHAVTHISVSADSISYDHIVLQQPRAKLDLQSGQQVKVDAARLQIGAATLDKPQIFLNISRHPTLLVTSSTLQSAQYQARNPRILLDYHTQPSRHCLWMQSLKLQVTRFGAHFTCVA